MELFDDLNVTSDSEVMSTVADSESDVSVDDNIFYTNRLLCADSFSPLGISCAIESSPEIKPLPYRRLSEVEKTVIMSGKVMDFRSTFFSSLEEVVASADDVSWDRQVDGCIAPVAGKGLSADDRNRIVGGAESEELDFLKATGKRKGDQNPLSCVEFTVIREAQSEAAGVCNIRAEAAPDQPQLCPPVTVEYPVTFCPGGLFPSWINPKALLSTPLPQKRVLCSDPPMVLEAGEGRRREGTVQAGVTRSAGRLLVAEPGQWLRSKSFSDKDSVSAVPSVQSSVNRKKESDQKLRTQPTVQTRRAAVKKDSAQMDLLACPSQPVGCRRSRRRPSHTCSEMRNAAFGLTEQSVGGIIGTAELESRWNSRRQRPPSANTKINTNGKRKTAPESELSVSGRFHVSEGNGKLGVISCAQTEPEKRCKGRNSKRKAAVRCGAGRVLKLCTVNRRNLCGETLLHRSAMDGEMELMRALLQFGVNVNVADYAGWTPLHEAASRGYYEMVAALLEAGANVNCIGDKGTSPLHDAVCYSHRQVAQLLLDNGANPLLKNQLGQTAFDITDDSSLKEMIARYSHKSKILPLSGLTRKRSRDNHILEDGQRQVVGMSQEKGERRPAKWVCGSKEAVKTRSSISKEDMTQSEQLAEEESRARFTSPILHLRSKGEVHPPENSKSPEGQPALPAESKSLGGTEDIRLPPQDNILHCEGAFETSSRTTDSVLQDARQNLDVNETLSARMKSLRKMGWEQTGDENVKSPADIACQSPLTHKMESQSPVAHKMVSQSPLAHKMESQSLLAHKMESKSPVAQRTMRWTEARKSRRLDLSPLCSVLCEAESRVTSAEGQEGHHTECNFLSMARRTVSDHEPSKPVKPECRNTGSECCCSSQADHADDMNLCSSSSFAHKNRVRFLEKDLRNQLPESGAIHCNVCAVFNETVHQSFAENAQEQQLCDLPSKSSHSLSRKAAENATGMKCPNSFGHTVEFQDNSLSQSLLPALPLEVEDQARAKGTTSDLIFVTSEDPVINGDTSDFSHNAPGIQQHNRCEDTGGFTVGSDTNALPLKTLEILRDSDLPTNMFDTSRLVHKNTGECIVDESSEECSISLLAVHSDAPRCLIVQQRLPFPGDGQEKVQLDASGDASTPTLQSDSSTPSLLIEDINHSNGLSPGGQCLDCDDRLHVASSANGNQDQNVSDIAKVIDAEGEILPASVPLQQEPPDSHARDRSLPFDLEDRSDLESRTVTEPVQMSEASSPTKVLPVVSQNCCSEQPEKRVQRNTTPEYPCAVQQVSVLTETGGNGRFTLSSRNTDRTTGRFWEDSCSLMTCCQVDSVSILSNNVQGTEKVKTQAGKILRMATESPELKCRAELLKETHLCNSALSRCSDTQVSSTMQANENSPATDDKSMAPKSNIIEILSSSNPKAMDLACRRGGTSNLDVNDTNASYDGAKAGDDETNISSDSECTMISESNHVEGNRFCAYLEHVSSNTAQTLASTYSQVEDNAKGSFESTVGVSVENGTEYHKGNVISVISSEKQNSAIAMVSGCKTKCVGNSVDIMQQNKGYDPREICRLGQKKKTSKSKNTLKNCKKEAGIQQNALSENHPASRMAKSDFLPATSCREPQQTLKKPMRNIKKRNSRGETRLHLASKRGDLALVRTLIEAGINVNQADFAGWTALHEASALGHTAIVEELLLSGADVNCRGLEGLTPLHDAVSSNHYETVQLLLQSGSNPSEQNIFGKSSLDLACDEYIKELLSTFHGPFLSPDVERRKPAAPSLRCESNPCGSGLPLTKLESTITTLETVEKKQREISTWKLTGPEDIGKFSEAFNQIKDILNSVLYKHKAENHDLTRKYRMASDSIKQGLLREQLMSLASRQRHLLKILQEQNALKLSFQQKSGEILAGKSSTLCPTAGKTHSESGTFLSIDSGPFDVTQQEAPFSCQGEVLEGIPSFLSVSSPSGVEVLHHSRDFTQITSDAESEEPETEVVALRLHPWNVVRHEDIPPVDHALYLENGSSETRFVQCVVSGHQSSLPSISQTAAGSRSDEQRSELTVTNKNMVDCVPLPGLLVVHNNSASMARCGHNEEHRILQTHLTRPSFAPHSSRLGHYRHVNSFQPLVWMTTKQNGEDMNTTLVTARKSDSKTAGDIQRKGSPHQVHVSAQDQNNSGETHSMKHRNSATALEVSDKIVSGTALSQDVQKSPCKMAGWETLPLHRDTVVSNRNLISLIRSGVVQPGDQVLQLALKHCIYRASLLADGSIKDMKDHLFLSPEEWVMSLVGPNIPVTSAFAWKKVSFRSKSLWMHWETSDLAAKCSATLPDSTPMGIHHQEEAAKTFISNFMEINKILLIRDDEFIPSRLMDQFWDIFFQSEDWEV